MMRSTRVPRGALALLALCLAALSGSTAGAKEYFQQFVHYTINVRLDTKERKLTGSETIQYLNNSPDTLQRFYLHLYPNAYKDKDTAFMRDYRRRFNYSLANVPKKHRSHLNIFNVTIDGQSVSPDIDDTIASMRLPKPLPPGGSMEIALDFEHKIRQHLGRAGYKGDHYDFAQWYPKVVVYDEHGFHPDKFMTGEFYGEFGEFDVHIEVPENFVVAATGVLKDGDPGWSINPVDGDKAKGAEKPDKNRSKTIHFHAEDVHDFAWNADPNFAVQDTTHAGIKIRSVFRKNNKAWKDSTLHHGIRTIDWLNERVGPYAYPEVNIVDALLGGGMEYPMLVMDGRASEGLVVHEVGHIYFYGILGNNERTEAWLDEGFTTFQTAWYEIEKYGPHGITRDWNWYQRLTPQRTEMERLRHAVFPLFRTGYGERIATRSEEFTGAYYPMVYHKAALVLFALRYVVGEEPFSQILHEYYEQWQLKHVDEARFQEVCERVSGQDLDWFFEQWLHSKKNCDYKLAKLESTSNPDGEGYLTQVQIKRLGEIIMPLEVEFEFKNRPVEKRRLDGRLRTIEEVFKFEEKPTRAAINPKNEIMDMNLADNFSHGRTRLQFDWPNNDFYPEDAYVIRYYPAAWYNDIDGARVWFQLSGSHHNWNKRIKLGFYYGFDSHRLDFSASYARPTRVFGNNATMRLSGYKLEGRQDATFELKIRRRSQLIRPPTHEFTYRFNYHELQDSRYVENPETYEVRQDVSPFDFGYRVNPQMDMFMTRIDLGLRISRNWFWGRYKYTSFRTEASLVTRPGLVPFDAGLRFFFGRVSGRMPFQQKFQLGYGGPLEEEKRFWLRSPGALPDDFHYHEPGAGNLRGYRPGSFGVNRLLTLNGELGGRIPILSRGANRFLGDWKLMGFGDVGWIFDDNNPIGPSTRVQALVDGGILNKTIVDAGLGLRWRRTLPFWDLYLRFDVPFYVNRPEVNAESKEVDFRWQVSFRSIF